jgi:hypothetical protein
MFNLLYFLPTQLPWQLPTPLGSSRHHFLDSHVVVVPPSYPFSLW